MANVRGAALPHRPPVQLALALPHAVSFAREDFLEGGANSQALALIDRWPDWPFNMMMLAGPEGSGKSHLAAIWAETSGARTLSAHALDEDGVSGALATGALVVDDLGAGRVDERALFHLINLAREEGAFVLVTARSAPAADAIHLRDLASRLRAVPVVQLHAPDDALLRALLVKLCADRQIPADEALISYLATRVERSFSGARRAIERLDDEALRLRRPVTRALAAQLLGTGAA